MFLRHVFFMISLASLLGSVPAELSAAEPELHPVFTPGHLSSITQGKISPDGRLIMTSAHEYPILSNVAGETLRIFKDTGGELEDIHFSNDSKLLLLASKTKMGVWNLTTGAKLPVIQELDNLPTSGVKPRCVVLSGDGKFVGAGNPVDNDFGVWDLATGKKLQTFTGHKGRVTCAVFSPDGKTVYTGSADTSVNAWNLVTGNKVEALLGNGGEVKSLNLSRDGKLLAVNAESRLTIWNAPTGIKLRTLGESERFGPSALTSDGKYLVSGDSDGKSITLWNIAKGEKLRTLPANIPDMTQLSLSADSKMLLVISSFERGSATLFDLVKGVTVRTIGYSRDELHSMHLSQDGKVLAVKYDKTGLVLWNMTTGDRQKAPEFSDYLSENVILSSDGKNVLSGYDPISVWSTATGTHVKKIKIPEDEKNVRSMALTPDNKYLATGMYTGAVIVWDVTEGKVIRLVRGLRSLAHRVSISDDGKTFAASAGRPAYVWNTTTGDRIAELAPAARSIYDIQLSRDGKLLAMGCENNEALLWDTATGAKLKSFHCQLAASKVQFSADEKALFALNSYGQLYGWDIATGKSLFLTPQPADYNEFGRPKTVALTKDGKLLIVAHDCKSNLPAIIRFFDTESGKERLALFVRGADWVAITPEGKVDGSGNGLKTMVAIKVGDTDEYQSFERHRAKFSMPKLMSKILRSEPFGADAAKGAAK